MRFFEEGILAKPREDREYAYRSLHDQYPRWLIFRFKTNSKLGSSGLRFFDASKIIHPRRPLRISFLPSSCRHKTQLKRGLKFLTAVRKSRGPSLSHKPREDREYAYRSLHDQYPRWLIFRFKTNSKLGSSGLRFFAETASQQFLGGDKQKPLIRAGFCTCPPAKNRTSILSSANSCPIH